MYTSSGFQVPPAGGPLYGGSGLRASELVGPVLDAPVSEENGTLAAPGELDAEGVERRLALLWTETPPTHTCDDG